MANRYCCLCPLSVSLLQKEISTTFQKLHSQLKSEACALMACDSPIIIWPNRGFLATPGEITPNMLCDDIHQWIL